MKIDNKELEIYYNFSLDFIDNFGQENYNRIHSLYPNEVEEREQINSIINSDLPIGEKIINILITQEFSPHHNFFHISYDHLLVLLIQKNNDIPPTTGEILKVKKLQELIDLIKNDLITKIGVREKYGEFSKYNMSQYIPGDPLSFYLETGNYRRLFMMIKSSDVKLAKSKLKKGTLEEFLSKVNRGMSYPVFKKERENFLAFCSNPSKTKKILQQVEYSTKFKIDPYTYNLLKTLRKKNLLNFSAISVDDLINVKVNLAPVYFCRFSKLLWGGLKKEIKSLSRVKNKNSEQYKKRLEIFLYRFRNLPLDRLKKLIL